MPSIPGIRTSISTTSGWCRRACSTASAPVPASPTTQNPGGGRDDAAEARRGPGPGRRRPARAGSCRPSGQRQPGRGPGSRRPAAGRRELAAAQADPFAHADDPVPGPVRAAGHGRPDGGPAARRRPGPADSGGTRAPVSTRVSAPASTLGSVSTGEPGSVTSISRLSTPYSSTTWQRSAPECLTTLVSASWTMRNADRSRLAGRPRGRAGPLDGDRDPGPGGPLHQPVQAGQARRGSERGGARTVSVLSRARRRRRSRAEPGRLPRRSRRRAGGARTASAASRPALHGSPPGSRPARPGPHRAGCRTRTRRSRPAR